MLNNGGHEFRPYAEVARCDMAAFLYRLAGSPAFESTAKQRAAFSDVDENTPHAKEVWWLVAQGISAGWDEADGTMTFRPYETVKRANMAAFLHRMDEKGLVGAAWPARTPTNRPVYSNAPVTEELRGGRSCISETRGAHGIKSYQIKRLAMQKGCPLAFHRRAPSSQPCLHILSHMP